MRAVRFSSYGGPEVLRVEDVPNPVPNPGEAIIDVERCGINPIDRSMLAGRFSDSLALPHTPGCEIVGTVSKSAADVDAPPVGTRVAVAVRLFCGSCSFCRSGDETACIRHLPNTPKLQLVGVAVDGGLAEKVRVPAKNLVPVPRETDLDQVACATMSAATANHALDRVGLAAGERILVVGATGGVGIYAVQLAALRWADVIAVVAGPAKARVLEGLAPVKTIDRLAGAYDEQVLEITDGAGVHVVFDPLGVETFNMSLNSLRRKGRFVTCGMLTGNPTTLDLDRLYNEQLTIAGATNAARQDVAEVLAKVSEGKLYSPIHASVGLDDAARGFQALDDPDRIGKVVMAS